MYGLIYKVINLINGKVYIGKTTTSLVQRRKEHERSNDGTYFHNSLIKYGKCNFKWEIVCYAEAAENLNVKETYYIIKNKSFIDFEDSNGMNLTLGGEGTSHSVETKQKISAKNKGRVFSAEHKRKLSESHKGYVHTEEQKRKISQALSGPKNHNYGKKYGPGEHPRIGIKHTEYTKNKIKYKTSGKNHRCFGKFGSNNPVSKKFVITTPDNTEFVVIGLNDFCRLYKKSYLQASNLSSVARQLRKTHKGHKCRYYNEKTDCNIKEWEG